MEVGVNETVVQVGRQYTAALLQHLIHQEALARSVWPYDYYWSYASLQLPQGCQAFWIYLQLGAGFHWLDQGHPANRDTVT